MKTLKQIVRKYYKYTYQEVSLSSLPTYQSADQAAEGINGISFTPTVVYPFIGKSSNTQITNSYNYEIIFTFKYGYMLKTWSFSGWVIPNQLPSAGVKAMYGSNDQETWTQISNNSSNTTFYTYYKLVLSGSEVGRYGSMGCNYFNMNGIIKYRVSVESDSSDYDYYRDISVPKILVDSNKYYALRTWEKGNYYGS